MAFSLLVLRRNQVSCADRDTSYSVIYRHVLGYMDDSSPPHSTKRVYSDKQCKTKKLQKTDIQLKSVQP